MFVNKAKGRFTGWIGYTISWTWRKFSDLNNGEKYPSKYDRRHDFSVVGTYELKKKWRLSSVFVFGTGNAISLPERFYFIDGTLARNSVALMLIEWRHTTGLIFQLLILLNIKSQKNIQAIGCLASTMFTAA